MQRSEKRKAASEFLEHGDWKKIECLREAHITYPVVLMCASYVHVLFVLYVHWLCNSFRYSLNSAPIK